MSSVTQRIKEVKQPYGGYIRPRDFLGRQLIDGVQLYEEENVHASISGMAVDYLTRFVMGMPAEEAFRISLAGAEIIGETRKAYKLLRNIVGLDDDSIINACKLVGYDVCLRSGPQDYKPIREINPDDQTVFNIRTMVDRSVRFWEEYGPITSNGFNFEGGYTDVITSGDGDYLTEDTLWDFKVSKDGLKTKHTLQLLVYYIMGQHSIHSEFVGIRYLGVFNPRLNMVYTYDVSQIAQEVIGEVECDIIGYSQKNKMNKTVSHEHQQNESTWSMPDLIQRYGVSRAKITSSFFAHGLPYYKTGSSYCFDPKEVMKWEIDQRTIPYGKNEEIVLPAYTSYRLVIKSKLKIARKNGDKESIRALKHEWKRCGYAVNIFPWIIRIIAAIILVIIFLNLPNFLRMVLSGWLIAQ